MSQAKLVVRKTVPRRMLERLSDVPKFQAPDGKHGWQGYEHFTDPTIMGFDKLTIPSQNCTIPSFDKIIPDKGKTLYGQPFTENVKMDGNKQKFKNLGGIEMEVREWASTSASLKDVIEVGYFNTRMVLSTIVGVFVLGEIVSGGTSGATGVITSITGTVFTFNQITGSFVVGEIITGQTSGATATTVLVPETFFLQITENSNPIPRGVHEYYFDSWFDTKLPNSIPNSVPGKNTPRLIWVNGYEDPTLTGPNVPNTRKGAAYSWTGGVAVITSFIANTSITINPLTTWRSLGFTENAAGGVDIVVNGVAIALTNPSDIDTSTVRVASTAGIAIGDTATSRIETDITPIPFDHCKQNKGYMYYGNWKTQQYYQSNGFNREYNYVLINYSALQNDLTFNTASPYTGTAEAVFHIVINSITPAVPAINDQSFVSGGGIQGNSVIDTTGYSAGVQNTYRILVVANSIITLFAGAGVYTDGEIVVGATSGAILRVVEGGNLLGGAMYTQTISGIPVAGETLTGQTSGTTRTILQFLFSALAAAYKNNVIQSGLPFPFNFGTGGYAQFAIVGTYAFSDGLVFDLNSVGVNNAGDYWELTIADAVPAQPDTFQWSKDGGALSAPIAITTAFQTLSDGLQIKFQSDTGHSIGDFWDIRAFPSVTRAWVNFYYALPSRRVGEGYIYQLPSPFWTHDTQEDSIYVNSTFGEWSLVQTILSADLLSESVSLTPLKQAGANKVLYPYLTGHINDDLVYINTEHSLDTLGRVPLLEKPQTGYLSDPVKLDFLASSFVGGRIKYFGKRLYITSPEDGVMHCYDTFKKYWQPIKTFPEMGLLTIIGNELACHSNIRNQTYTLFTNSSGDASAGNINGYPVEIRTAYKAPNGPWRSSFSNMSFTTGYITGAPKLVHTVYLGINGCGGVLPHDINPIVCLTPDRSPFGEGPFGSHPNGSDLDVLGSYFNEIYKAYSPIMQYYFLQIGINCVAKSHTYSILALGMNGMASETGNNNLVNPDNLAINNV